ncbi:hypothetical protein BK138_16170 [Paenibacillus rhizosphaerae]|uniref:Uncharacterized protein n=1 Tax=Paenibacillus rhizosphaerae TaxID=297318 RepID=A0A1R1ES53_9BACL|nr:hypothetical protein [Paenibacillus rhizosphaerae]OMF54693.1 hypothetical protein BK138_16170 [Paenibacillus rhizosphaerae]
MFEVNFNDEVKVKLTEHGLSLLEKEQKLLNEYIQRNGGKGVGEYKPRIDEDGYTSFQLWDLMHRLGPYLSLGLPEPFEGRMIFPNGRGVNQKQGMRAKMMSILQWLIKVTYGWNDQEPMNREERRQRVKPKRNRRLS